MPSSCDWWRQNFINLLRWAGQHVISAYPLAGKLSEAGTDSCLWVFIAPFMSLPSTLCFKRYPAAVENQANLCCVRWLSSLSGVAVVVFSLSKAGLRTLISKALLSRETSGAELPLSYCTLSAGATRGRCGFWQRSEPPASLLTTWVREQNSFSAKGLKGGKRKLAIATNPETGRMVS